MSIYHHRAENRALRQEARAQRKEDRLHMRATNQLLKGNVGRAMRIEAKADKAHHRAAAAGARADMHHAAGHHHHTHLHFTGPHHYVHQSVAQPVPGVTVYQWRNI
ncbi:uncharacterized protein [Diadema antillarum]|uniref:uncharacterized protein n=1 Tax=Diadema antillarum TaxID=105358 RepID=UPI003A841D10